MVLYKKIKHLSGWLSGVKSQGLSVGFVPTMGALHAGHLALIGESRKANHRTVASIFVNPTQFNDKKDFEKYPVTIEKDIELLAAAGCDALFCPSVEEIYPEGYLQPAAYDLGYLETVLEGKYRPGHFQGVCRVMDRLLSVVQPGDLYMGQKDYQQCLVVRRLIDLMQIPVRMHTIATRREPDGLAMSSRNMRLTQEERENASTIFRTLKHIQKNIKAGPADPIVAEGIRLLEESDFRVDYAAIADATTLETVSVWDGAQKIVALIAAFQKEVRLIDNLRLN